jgi:heavy metal sensor kinase
MSPRSLRFQLTAWYASLVCGGLALLGVVLAVELNHYLKRNLGETQLRRAQQMAEALLADVSQSGPAYVTNQLKSVYAPEANDRFVRITRFDGTVLYVSGPPKDQSFDPLQVPPLERMPKRAFWREQKLSNHASLMIAAFNYRAPDGNRFVVEVGAPTGPIQAMMHRLVLQLLIGLPLALIAVVGGGYYLVHRSLKLVDRLASKAEKITQHNLSERLPVMHTGDELERLSVSLNHMIARLEDAFLTARRFGADASHELRTPLTVLRGELESVVQDPRLAADLRASLASVLEEVERLANTVEGLFAISRLDAGEAQTEWVPLDLAALAANTADQMSLLAEDKGIAISCEAAGPVLVAGDRGRLKQVVVNLLDNAIKYTPEKGAVKLRVCTTNGHARLEVEDNGIGIPAEALPHVFERFFRVDKVRSRDLGGAGLGLSIVKSICTAHGAEVLVQSKPGQGSRFRVELPLAAGPTHSHTKTNNHEH